MAAGAAPEVVMRLDYSGAEAVITALTRDSLDDAALDSLLQVHGVRAMVDNVTFYFAEAGESRFRESLMAISRTKSRPPYNRYFELWEAWNRRAHVQGLVAAIRADEVGLVQRALAEVGPYRPETGPVRIDVHFVAGGVSDGFVVEDASRTALYANLVREEGDIGGVAMNMAHEAYHVLQKVAQRRAGLGLVADSADRLPPGERLLVVLLAEGTANYVVDPTRSTVSGASIEASRARYRRNVTGQRIRENFALFDTVLTQLRSGSLSWQQAYSRGFSGNNDARFYFVGYEMARAIERHCGRRCIGRLFRQEPAEFFRQYVELYRRHPDIVGRFAPETEAFLLTRMDRR